MFWFLKNNNTYWDLCLGLKSDMVSNFTNIETYLRRYKSQMVSKVLLLLRPFDMVKLVETMLSVVSQPTSVVLFSKFTKQNYRSWWWYPSYAQFVLCLTTSTHTCDQVIFSSLWLLLNFPQNLKTNMNHIFLNIGIWTPPFSRKYVLFFQLCILHRCFT